MYSIQKHKKRIIFIYMSIQTVNQFVSWELCCTVIWTEFYAKYVVAEPEFAISCSDTSIQQNCTILTPLTVTQNHQHSNPSSRNSKNRIDKQTMKVIRAEENTQDVWMKKCICETCLELLLCEWVLLKFPHIRMSAAKLRNRFRHSPSDRPWLIEELS